VSSAHIRVTDQKSYEDRHKPDILYAEWTVKEADDQVIVTRTEYRYLKNGEGAVFLAILPELRQGRLDLTIEPPDNPTIDHLDAHRRGRSRSRRAVGF
jgi:hypothetical protein